MFQEQPLALSESANNLMFALHRLLSRKKARAKLKKGLLQVSNKLDRVASLVKYISCATDLRGKALRTKSIIARLFVEEPYLHPV